METTTHLIDEEIAHALGEAQTRVLRSMEQFIEEEIYIADGPYAGLKYLWDRQPVHKLIVNEIDSGDWVEIYITGPSQSGKTLIAFCYPLLYHMTEMGETVVMAVPEGRMASDKWQIDLLPPMESSPMLEQMIPSAGPGSKGGTIRDTITFSNGVPLKIMTRAGSDQSKAGYTARVVCVTEAAGFSRSMSTSEEADPLKQLQARQRAWDRDEQRLFVEGTVTIEEQLPYSARRNSSATEILSECPWCGDGVLPGREDLVGYQSAQDMLEAGELAHWKCPTCGEKIDDEMRREMVANAFVVHEGQWFENGEVHGERVRTDRLWIRYTAWHNMFVSTKTLGQEEWEASRLEVEDPDHESTEKERCQFVWVTPFKSSLQEHDPLKVAHIIGRKDDYPRGYCPDDTTHLAYGMDMGQNVAWFVILAGRADGRTHYVDYGPLDVLSREFPLDVALLKMMQDATATFKLGYILEDHKMVPKGWGDAGWETDSVFTFARSQGSNRRNTQFMPAFGRGEGQLEGMYKAPRKRGNGIVEIGNNWHVSMSKKHRSLQAMFNSDYWKLHVQHAFHLHPESLGASTLFSAPQTVHKQLARHIVNEQRFKQFVPDKGEIWVWQKTGAQHLLDAAANARAALDRAGFKTRVQLPVAA